MWSKRKALTCALVGVVLVVQAIALGGPLAQDARAAAPTELFVGFLEAIDSLNPFRGINDPAYVLEGLIYDFLFSLDEDGNFVPNIALDAHCDATCRNWTYEVRQGVVWHDGTPLTANDVAFTVNYNIQNFVQLWNFEPYVNRIIQCAGGQTTGCGAQVTSPWNVTVYFDRPFVPGKALFLPIIQEAQWGSISPSQAQYHYQNPNPIGTGPFMADAGIFDQWFTAQPLLLHKNPNYHPVGTHVGPALIDRIYLQQFSDENTLVSALRAGTIQLAKLTSAGYGSLGGIPGIERQETLPVTHYGVEVGFTQLYSTNVNSKLNPTRWDERVRRALAMGTNKDYIIQTIYQGKGVRGTSLMSPVTPQWYYDPTKDTGVNLTFDESAANALLDAAGYTTRTPTPGIPDPGLRSAATDLSFRNTNGVDVTIPQGTPVSFTMATRLEFPQEQQTALYLKAAWARLGVDVTIKSELEAALSDDVYGGAVETYIWYWSGDPDPNYLLSVESGFLLDGWNDNYWDNATYNQLYLEQLAATDPSVREDIVQAAQRLHYRSAVYITYIFTFGEWAYRTDRFTGWGDWTAHPYRQMDAYWGANPLFLELTTTGGVRHPPTVPLIQGSPYVSTFVNTALAFAGTASDPDANDTLSWSWNWGDTHVTIHQHPATVTQDNATYSWPTPGNYTVTLSVSDGFTSVTSDPVHVNVMTPTSPLGWLNGTVRDPQSNPISGATVTTSPGSYQGTSGGTGAYAIRLPAGTYSADADAPLFRSATLPGLVVAANSTTWANFTLTPNAGWLAGTVTSSADGAALPGATVYATSTAGRQYSGVAGTQGRYNLTLDPGNYSVEVSATGYRTQTRAGVVVDPGETVTQDFALEPVSVSTPGLSTLVVAAIAIGIVAVAAIVVYLLLRRRKKGGEQRVEVPR